MSEQLAAAAAYGIAVKIADLGTWAGLRLISEYDPRARAIRINARALDEYRRVRVGLTSDDVRAFIDLAVAHELYHHREACGELPRLATRAQREAAADGYARASVPVDDRLDAFLTSRAAR
jgi:hypothetical protein